MRPAQVPASNSSARKAAAEKAAAHETAEEAAQRIYNHGGFHGSAAAIEDAMRAFVYGARWAAAPVVVEGVEAVEWGVIPDPTPTHGMDWRDGLDALDALLNDCSQIGGDHENFVRVQAVRHIVNAVRRYEDDTDESIRSALWEDAVANGEPWAMESPVESETSEPEGGESRG